MTPAQLRNAQWRRELEDEGLTPTRHCLERMAEMGVTPARLAEAVRRGSSFPQRSAVTGRRGTLRALPGEGWAAVTAEGDDALVITVVFRRYDRYVREGRTARQA